MKEKLLEAMNAGIFKAHLLLEYTGCTDLNEFCEAMLSLVRGEKDQKIRSYRILRNNLITRRGNTRHNTQKI